MKNGTSKSASLIALVLMAAPAFAQMTPISDAGFAAALSGVRTAFSETRAQQAAKPQQPSDDLQIGIDRLGPADMRGSDQHCSDAAALEKSKFMLSYATERGELHLLFTYAGCKEEPRNDYLPPYTERYYRASDGYAMALVTDEGAESSAVVVSYKGPGMKRDAVWTYGQVANSKLTTSGVVDLGEVEAMDYREPGKALKAKAQIQVQAEKAAEPDMKACEAAMTKSLNWTKVSFGDNGKPYRGFDAVRYGEYGSLDVSLVLLTQTEAYYYYEPCDICADVDKCDLKTGAITNVVHAHSSGCGDLSRFSRTGVVYDACAKEAPAAR